MRILEEVGMPMGIPNGNQSTPRNSRSSVNIFGIRIANFWLTVLGEVPATTLELLAQSIQYVPPVGSR